MPSLDVIRPMTPGDQPRHLGRRGPDADPFESVLAPPSNETDDERQDRIEQEKSAKKASEVIDAQIERERQELTKSKKQGDIRVLLLGQSESGKSTTVKNFQLQWSPSSWKRERTLWRAVIFLNLVKSVRRIINVLVEDATPATISEVEEPSSPGGESTLSPQPATPLPERSGTPPDGGDGEPGLSAEDVLPTSASSPPAGATNRDRADTGSDTLSAFQANLSAHPLSNSVPQNVQLLIAKLTGPLERVESALIGALSSSDDPEDVGGEMDPTRLPATVGEASNVLSASTSSSDNGGGAGKQSGTASTLMTPSSTAGSARQNGRETTFSATHWKRTLASTKRLSWLANSLSLGMLPSNSSSGRASSDHGTPATNDVGGAGANDVLSTLISVREDIKALWEDPYVIEVLKKRRYRPQDSSGFYLNDSARILQESYTPTDEDVLNARLKTVGIIQHDFKLDRGSEKGVNWTIYDVGGARNQRHVWASFFDDVNAIIFLAPISAFNQVLSEDPRVNRVQDSLQLFKAVCKNKLLRKVHIVLFLNKIDILKAKLENGIMVNKYVISYGNERPNELEPVCKFFRNAFGAVFKDTSQPDRELFIHMTTMSDPKSAKSIISNLRELLLRKALERSSLL